jgi:hypothetical protein
MSIQSQINRINGAKDNLVTSIENQGVAVPDGTKIDALSTYVDAINNSNHNHEISDVTGLQNALDAKLEKTTYEKSAELALGSNGKVCLGKFGAYDTNITIELNSTTHTGYHATIIIFSQNVAISSTNGSVGCYVYGDANNYVTPLLSIFRPYGSASRQIEVYANLPGWSKNLVHVQGVALSTGGMTDVLTSVETIPTAIDGKIKVTPVNALTANFASKAEATTLSNQIGQKANQADLDNLSADVEDLTTEVGKKANASTLHKVATSGSYNDLTNKPTIPSIAGLMPLSGGTITGKTTIDTTSNTDMTNPAVNILHTGPATGSDYADLMILSGFKQAPYGFKFRTYGDGTAIIQSQRINSNSEWFNLSLNPNGGQVLANGSPVVTETRLQAVLGSYVNDIDALLGG